MGRIQNILHQLDLLQYSWRAKVASKKEIQDPRRKKILNSFELSDEQKKKIDDFYIENYGKKRSEEHTSELQSRPHLVCRLLLEKKKKKKNKIKIIKNNNYT